MSPEQAIVGYELVHSAGNSAASRPELAAPDGKWTRAWEGNRPGDRKEKFRLYKR